MPEMTEEEKAEFLEKMERGRERKQFMEEYLERRRNGEDITLDRLIEEKKKEKMEEEREHRWEVTETKSGDSEVEVPVPFDPPLPSYKIPREDARELLEAMEEVNDPKAVIKAIKSIDIKPYLIAHVSKGCSSPITISLNPKDFLRLDEIQNFVYKKRGHRIFVSTAVKIAIRLAWIKEDNLSKVMEALEMEDQRGRKHRKARKR